MSFDVVPDPYNAKDPMATFLAGSCLDFLLMEMVPMAQRLANELAARSAAIATRADEDPATEEADAKAQSTKSKKGKPLIARATAPVLDEEDLRSTTHARLEALGYRVGQGLVERFSRDRARFLDPLDMIKFVCKDVWQLIFRKQIDNLKTNHRGVYVLTDAAFRPFTRMSMGVGMQAEAVGRAQPWLWFPCGVIRGALASMGVQATVVAETSELPGATFQIKTAVAKSRG